MGVDTQRDKVRALLAERGMLRQSELAREGITSATVSRMAQVGEIVRLARGLYQLAGAASGADHGLAEAAKRIPRGIVCLVSALAFHDLTDQLPGRTWMAIGHKDWQPVQPGMRVRIVRFADRLLAEGVETHNVEQVPIKIFGVAKTIADCFRYRNKIGLSVAIEGLQEALRQRKATPAEIARQAERGGVLTVMRPYLEAFTAHG